MKKIYIIPELQFTRINSETIIATSKFSVDKETTVNSYYVKGNEGSRQDYNVWNDDWQNQ